MARKQFEQTVAAVPRESLQGTLVLGTVAVPAGGSDVVYVYSPAGSVGRLQNVNIFAAPVAGATSGTHGMTVSQVAPGGSFIVGSSAYNKSVNYDYFEWASADTKRPLDPTAAALALKDVMFDETNGLRITYENATNQLQNQNRQFWLSWIKSDSAK